MKTLSLTTLRELARLSLPMMVSKGTFAVMIFTDRWFMSNIDATHIAATLGGGVASYFCFSLFLGIISYANPLVAQYYGAGEVAKCPRVVTQGVLMALACVPLLFLAGYFGGDAFALMGHDPAQVPLERIYFQVLMGGSLFNLLKTCLACYFVGIGRSRVVMVTDVMAVMLNIPLSWALIFGKLGLPELGIAGAALGTVVATGFAVCVFLVFYLAKEHQQQFQVAGSFRFEPGIMRRYLRLGTPAGVEGFLNTATFNLFLLMFQSYGVVEGASMAIVFNWDMLSFIPMVGLHIGVMSLIGRFVGARDMARANQVISSGFILALGYSGVLAILFLVFRVPLVEVFSTPGQDFGPIRDLASSMMIGLTTYMLADAIILIAGGALRGAGDTRWTMLMSTSLHGLMLVAQYLVIVELGYGPLVSWWVFVAMLISLALLYLWRLLGGRWRLPDRLARVMQE
ncbi:MAG: MATE family efflux transporter [Gammaproteobacteria bacterium]|nr:MATE family efflux transporter [Gammaproteobacteria bacterium]